MKTVHFFLLIVIFIFPVHFFAQHDISIPGEVVEQNSRINTGEVKFLPKVSIKSPKAAPAVSDSNGKFTLIFADQPFGGRARISAAKSGFVVVNEKELESAAVLGRKTALKVVMCAPDSLYKNQMAYYEIADEAIRKIYEQKIALLSKENKKSRQLMTQLGKEMNRNIKNKEEAITALEEQRFLLEQQVKELANKFVAVNLDDQTETYIRAYKAFLDGKLDLTIAILDSVNLEVRLEANQNEKTKVEGIMEEMQDNMVVIEKQMEQDLEQLLFKARSHWVMFQFDEALESYELALKYDIPNVRLRWEYADKLFTLNQFKKSIEQYNLASKYCQDEEVRSMLNLNAAIVIKGGGIDLEDARRELYTELQSQREKSKWDLEQNLPMLARTLNASGVLHIKLPDLEKAKRYLEEAVVILEVLADNQPEFYAQDLANSLTNLAVVLDQMKKYYGAKRYYERALKIYNEVSENYQKDLTGEIAAVYNNLGVLSLNQSNEILEDQFLFKSYDLYMNLVAKNHRAFNIKLAMVCINVARLFQKKIRDDYQDNFKVEGIQYLSQADTLLKIYPPTLPDVQSYYKKINELQAFFNWATEERMEEDRIKEQILERTPVIDTIINNIASNPIITMDSGLNDDSVINKYKLTGDPFLGEWQSFYGLSNVAYSAIQKADTSLSYEMRLSYYFDLEMDYILKGTKYFKREMVQVYNGLAKNYLCLGNFKDAEKVCKKAIKLDKHAAWIPVNLSLAYLYQGKWRKAKKIYLENKVQLPDGRWLFKKPFLKTLEQLEAVGFSHPDVSKAKALLNEQ